jgi:hypothetical protein
VLTRADVDLGESEMARIRSEMEQRFAAEWGIRHAPAEATP